MRLYEDKMSPCVHADNQLRTRTLRAALAQARKVVQLCDANPTDAFALDYDERNPFVVCNKTYVPIYRGTALLSCSYCKAPYSALPEHKGALCPTCGLGEIGGDSIGMYEIDAEGKPL